MSFSDARPGTELGEATVASGLYAPLVARGHVSRWLDGFADADVRANACLLVSELVTNIVQCLRTRENDAYGRDSVDLTQVRARATDAAGHVRPDVPPWNRLGYGTTPSRSSTSACAERR